jgi:hypothetical protein
MSRHDRLNLYTQQLQLLESNTLRILLKFLAVFLKAGTHDEDIDIKNRIFKIFKFGYYRNSMCISSFVQKSNLSRLEDIYPEDIFQVLDFGFYNNWIAFTSKGLLTFSKNLWVKTILKLKKSFEAPINPMLQNQLYRTLITIMRFISKWSLSDEESVLKYLSSSSL